MEYSLLFIAQLYLLLGRVEADDVLIRKNSHPGIERLAAESCMQKIIHLSVHSFYTRLSI